MTAARTVRRQAPGKLFIAGEYAVLEPGHPAILIAVDRHVSVTVSALALEDADVEIDSDLRAEPARLRVVPSTPSDGLGPVVSAIEVVDALLAERAMRRPPVRLKIRSRLHRAGTKFGLGSSGAVTVATVTAVAQYCGVELSPASRFRLALLSAARCDPRSSGGDLAASVWGGWIAYQAPDRAAVLELAERRGIEEMLRAPWPGFRVRRLPPPRGLAVEVGWTGQPASTSSLAGRFRAGGWGFVARSDACVAASIGALERGDDRRLLHRIRDARALLAELDDRAGLGIFTARLTALCDAAEAAGGAAKPSGAGGGDCGIALLDAGAEHQMARLRAGWAAAGVTPIPIRVQAREGNTR
jgi:phosphomevalonate kinase